MNKPLTAKQQAFVTAWATGMQYKLIAQTLGVTERRCYYLRKRLGLPSRPHGRYRESKKVS